MKPIRELDLPDDHGVTQDVVDSLAAIVGRVVLNFALIDAATFHLHEKLPQRYQTPSRAFDDRLEAIKLAAKNAEEMWLYRDRVLAAISLARHHTAVRDVLCHWSLAEFRDVKGGRFRFLKSGTSPGGEPAFAERWYYMSEIRRANTSALEAADMIYEVLFEDEGEVRPSSKEHE